ncbi:MAG: class I SAM-dependent RNA methyltransferase [Hyphomicrobiaceae bacterium]
MTTDGDLEIFFAAPPGLEAALLGEVREQAFARARPVAGGVTAKGAWRDVWRACLGIRGASRIVPRFTQFRAVHLSQLDKSARRVPWESVLRKDVPFRVEASCRASRIYHTGAAAERVERAIREELGAEASATAEVCVRVRIERDMCSIGVDAGGELLHKRGFKEEVAKAPLRETMAALLLRCCGFTGSEPVLDPMCGSGTFVIEAAEIAAGLAPGRGRHFAFEKLATFDAAVWREMRGSGAEAASAATPCRFYGSDRDAGAVRISRANAERAGVATITEFRQLAIEEIERPAGPPGLVIVNPPYGARIGDRQALAPLYRALGAAVAGRFSGWRVGLVTTEKPLAQATGLPFGPPAPAIPHGGLRIQLFQTGPLP